MDPAVKQQVVERIKQAEHILVTVSTDPSVDQLAACIGLTLMLNKMQKHGTAIYSGKTPSTIEFLQPAKTLETNTDSLRDFIISLDKNKADKLRYKVEDQVVRIYITPYKTSLSQKDLVFSEGDYNVDLVMALGVRDKGHLDAAIMAHGRILHDAAVVCVNAGAAKGPEIGQINWQDAQASSLCEMLTSISEALGAGLIDNQIATAFLTGIVAETERFSNPKTSPKVMTMSAQLMAAGANQQLIATKLAPPPPPPPPPPPKPLTPPPSAAVPAKPKQPEKPPKPADSGEIVIEHEPKDKKKDKPTAPDPNEIRIDEKGNIENVQALYKKTHPQVSQSAASGLPSMLDRANDGQATPPPPPVQAPVVQAPLNQPGPHVNSFRHDGGHDMFATHSDSPASATSSAGGPQDEWYDPMNADQKDGSPIHDGLVSKAHDVTPDAAFVASNQHPPVPPPVVGLSTAPTVSPDGNRGDSIVGIDSARSAVENAVSSAPYNAATAGPIVGLGAQPMGGQLHPPTDTLPLPPNGSIPARPSSDIAPAAAPPVPPPLHLSPGVVAPNMTAPAGAKQYNQNSAVPSPNSPNTAWPV